MPSAIKQSERRKNPRSAFSPREEVGVSVLQTLGAGIGVTGTVTDVSTGGICLTIERALKLENEKQVTVRSDLLPKGTELMLIKIKGIPGVPTFETNGIVNRISGPGKWKLAIELLKIPAPIKAAIEKFVKSRYHKPIPVRRSYQKRQEMQKQRELEREQEKQEAAAQETQQDTRPGRSEGIKFVKDDLSPEAVEQITGASLEPEPEPEPKTKPEPKFEPEPQFTPEPEFAPDGEGMPLSTEPLKPILISLGKQLQEQLVFLSEAEQYEWVHVDTPVKIIRFLRERKTDFLLLPLEYKRQGMLEYLEKVSGMGLLKDVGIILLTGEQISPKDMVKCRMLGIQHIIELPLPNPGQVLDIIKSKAPGGDSSAAPL
jgi:hypothetical protein